MQVITEIIAQHAGDILAILAAAGVVIEVTPIKVNPLSKIAAWFGKAANAEILERIDLLDKKIETVRMDTIKDHKKESRILISNFANDIRRGVHKDESQYIAIMDLVNEYLSKGWNSKVKMEAEFIKRTYNEMLAASGKAGGHHGNN